MQAFASGEQMTIGANNARSVEGHPAKVIAEHDDLIERSNGLRL